MKERTVYGWEGSDGEACLSPFPKTTVGRPFNVYPTREALEKEVKRRNSARTKVELTWEDNG